ncbi:Hypothetical predicted protein [Paramuricea clavata]|uniref:Uncharacterized protein n=1 Tax=Paramuricea clavata TaxID=317549 RepID=A0A6S7H8I5_PARCT|nr:Hypothetical predicted protein [Paramuricea clavata]
MENMSDEPAGLSESLCSSEASFSESNSEMSSAKDSMIEKGYQKDAYYQTWRYRSTENGILNMINSGKLWTTPPAKEQYLRKYLKELCDEYQCEENGLYGISSSDCSHVSAMATLSCPSLPFWRDDVVDMSVLEKVTVDAFNESKQKKNRGKESCATPSTVPICTMNPSTIGRVLVNDKERMLR